MTVQNLIEKLEKCEKDKEISISIDFSKVDNIIFSAVDIKTKALEVVDTIKSNDAQVIKKDGKVWICEELAEK